MVRYFIERPVAVFIIFTALTITGLLLIRKVPVSLLPDIDVPQIIIRVNYPNTATSVMEHSVIGPIRESVGNIVGLKSIESRSSNHIGTLQLVFEYGTRMDLAYIEVNEKLDRLTPYLPGGMQRPEVIRVNTSDIPIVRIQITPKDEMKYFETSMLAEKVLKRRIEQIEGVSVVDMNGITQRIITITPDKTALAALNLNEGAIIAAIQNANRQLGGLSIKEGQYQYFIKLVNTLENESAVADLPIINNGKTVIPISRVATVKTEISPPTGYHLYNGKEGIVITVQKQPDSRMNELVPEIKAAVDQFHKEYPQIDFALSQDQTFLLDAGINNLEQDVIYGGILTALLLFVFLGNWASPSLMIISIPLSLVITFIFFYLFKISFNIISLSGLALGVGMLIDNSIVVIDNITRKRISGLNMAESSITGTHEVIVPVISQVLTTVAVYVPLIFLNDMAGALVFDQAIGLTICLCVSLLIAFILSPLLYRMLLKSPSGKLKEHTRLYNWVAKGYHKMISHILQHRLTYLFMSIAIMPLGILVAPFLPVSALPRIEKKESLVLIDWNAPIDAKENYNRVNQLLTDITSTLKWSIVESEADIGIWQFILQQGNNTVQKAEIYIRCKDEYSKLRTDLQVRKWLRNHYSQASIEIIDAPNAFTQLFQPDDHYLEARFKQVGAGDQLEAWEALSTSLKKLPDQTYALGAGFIMEPNFSVLLDYNKMYVYGVSRNAIEDAMQQQFGVYNISELKGYGQVQTVRLSTDRSTIDDKLMVTVPGRNKETFALNQFVTLINNEQPKFITSDRSGLYRAIIFNAEIKDAELQQKEIRKVAANTGFTVYFTGRYFENRQQLRQLVIIFITVLLLLYFILAMQYESLIQPLIVMLTIPLGISGGMVLLWLTGGTLNIMAAIGFIVILGLIVDDPILKIETLNRLEKKYIAEGLNYNDELLERMIHESGDYCLKPLLLVSLTTSIAVVPVLFISGIGNDLQKPLSVVIIGGLTIGTFFTTWFIPLAYWYVIKWTRKRKPIDQVS